MGYLKSDFLAALAAAVSTRPAAAAAYRAGDPRLMAQMEANAAMLAMLSQQLDVAEVEPFVKARMGTVLADAALKGVLPLARPARVQLTVSNPTAVPLTIAVGRAVLDGKGRRYAVDGAATVPAAVGLVPGTATITAQQLTTRQIEHTVAGTVPFYEVPIAESPDGAFLAGIDVEDTVGAFTYSADYCNVAPGQRVFHVETDEYRRLRLRFGAADAGGAVIGHQPANGDVLTITLRECSGLVELDAGAGFSLEYVGNANEAELSMVLATMLASGAKPADVDVLRMLARYPALHDSNAVFLSNFDFLLRRHIAGITFLSVWNEQVEEAARGASVANVNKLFVSFVIPSQSGPTSQAQIRSIIARADDSYKVAFVAPRLIAVPVTVNASVSVVHDAGDVEAQIRTVLLTEYGEGSIAASRGRSTIRLQQLSQLLQDNVPALQDQISDVQIVIGATASPLPEDFRYFTTGSITVNVVRVSDATGLWNA